MSLKLFVADDSVTIQKIVNLAFSGEDVTIKAVSDGNSAVDLVREFKPDVVLADVFMPGRNGYEVCELIKQDPELNQIPVILLVGTFEPFDESEASRVRADRFLTKPFDTAELIQAVHELAKWNTPVQETERKAQDALSQSSGQRRSPLKGTVSSAAWESFLGNGRVLELFDPDVVESAKTGSAVKSALKPAGGNPDSEMILSEDFLNRIVDRVVRKISSEVIREVAWDVVPELSESIIRQALQERK